MHSIRSLMFGVALLAGTPALAQGQAPANPPPPPFTLTSASFQDGGVVPDKYSQAVPNPVSPQLSWINAPAGTQSYVVLMHDPDVAPRKSVTDILHWMAFNIPGSATSLAEGVPNNPTLPDGTVQPNNFGGKPGYMGMGSRGVYHHYTIELFAIDQKLGLGADATRQQVMEAIDGHILGKAVIVGRFKR